MEAPEVLSVRKGELFRRTMILCLAFTGAAGFIVGLAGIKDVGIGWDTDFDTYASVQVRTLPAGLTLDEAFRRIEHTSEYYGILVQTVADWFNHLAGGPAMSPSGWLDTFVGSTWIDIYRWQAVTTLSLSVISSLVLAVCMARTFDSPLVGVSAWALCMTTPLMLGQAIVNFKDSPLASGMTLYSCGLMLAVGKRVDAKAVSVAMVVGSMGASCALGSRAGAWPLLVVLVAGASLGSLMYCNSQERWKVQAQLWAVALTAWSVSLLVLLLINPLARIDLLRWLAEAAFVAGRYQHVVDTLTNGTLVPSTQIPWWYVPAWILAQTPILTTILIMMGACWLLASATRSLVHRRSDPRLRSMSPIVTQAVVLPAAVVAAGSTLYDGIRHLTFMLPTLLAIAAVGIFAVERWFSSYRGTSLAPTLALVVSLLGLFGMIRWYPYMYSFINPVANHDPASRNWELDYWGVTAREGVERLRDQGLDPVWVYPTERTAIAVGATAPNSQPLSLGQSYGAYRFLIRRDSEMGDSECAESFRIVRDGATLGIGAACRRTGR